MNTIGDDVTKSTKLFEKMLMVGYVNEDFEKVQWDAINELTKKLIILPKDSDQITNELLQTDCLLVKLGASVDNNIIDLAPMLKYIGMLGTGYGRIDTKYASIKGISVCNIAGYSTESVAEFAIGIILEYLREIERGKKQVREENYSESGFNAREIKNKAIGIIGLGRIGGRIADIAHSGFGANVMYWSRTRKINYEQNGIPYQDINIILKECDIISVNLALTPDTDKILSKEKLRLIKKGAVLLNLSPMELIDIEALELHLQNGDFFFIFDHSDEVQPEIVKRLVAYKNCIVYPPIAYISQEASIAKREMFINNIKNYLKGVPTNKVN